MGKQNYAVIIEWPNCFIAENHFFFRKLQKFDKYQLGDNCIQNFPLGRHIIGYTVRNLVLQRRVSRDVKLDFGTYIRRYTSPNDNFEYGYPHSNALLQSHLKL